MALKMKELEARTGVSRETIRFYIREGILPEPEKPKRNVAIYTDEHVSRIRLIKELQDRHFLPLKQVKAVVESEEARAYIESGRMPGVFHYIQGLVDHLPGPDRHIEEVVKTSGLCEEEIRELADIGAISFTEGDRLPFRDAAIVETWGSAFQAGFSKSAGYDAAYLGKYVAAIRHIAEFEAEQFLATHGTDMESEAAAELGAQGIEIVNKLLSLLHTKFILKTLEEQSGSA